MFTKLSALWRVFRAGESVADPVAWKRGQITVAMLTTLGGAVLALLRAFDVRLDISPDQMVAIASGILAIVGVFNQFSTAASTDKIDALGRAALQPVADSGAGIEPANPIAQPAAEPLPGVAQSRTLSLVERRIENDFLKQIQRDSLGG
ncbi:MAG: hypothetical protein JNM52_10990 [Betaproteobacteria bacterium]|nr:hypothetical protein [Betaproteobacteria bacterium]